MSPVVTKHVTNMLGASELLRRIRFAGYVWCRFRLFPLTGESYRSMVLNMLHFTQMVTAQQS